MLIFIASGNDVIRLVSTGDCSTPEGRVEIFHDGAWGTVCDDAWSTNNARVVCRQLGFTEGNVGVPRWSAYYQRGTGRILLDDVDCQNNENNLLSCQHPPIGRHNCGHHEDAGVSCATSGMQ